VRLALKVTVQNYGESVNVISVHVARSSFELSQKQGTDVKNAWNVRCVLQATNGPGTECSFTSSYSTGLSLNDLKLIEHDIYTNTLTSVGQL